MATTTKNKSIIAYEEIMRQAELYTESYKTRSEEVQEAVKHAYINGAKTAVFHLTKSL